MFTVYRIYSDSNGDSCFENISVPLRSEGKVGKLSKPFATKDLFFREVDPSYDWDFHTAPQRQYIVLLEGEIEIETSLHQKKIFRTGDILLVEDTTGKGHKTRNLQPLKRRSLFITLPDK
jgi:hypothetical protein